MIFTENLAIELIKELKAHDAILADITFVTMKVDNLEKYQKTGTTITNYKSSVLLQDDNGVQFRHTLMLFPNGGTQKLWNLFESHFHNQPLTQINQPIPINPGIVIGECVMINLMHKLFDANKQNNFASRRNVALKGEWYAAAIQMLADVKYQTNNNSTAPAPNAGYKQQAPAPAVQAQAAPAQTQASWTPPVTGANGDPLPY